MGVDKNGTIWVADFKTGWLKLPVTNSKQYIRMVLPITRFFRYMPTEAICGWLLAEGPVHGIIHALCHNFQLNRAGEWKNFSKKDFPGLSGFFDVVSLVADPKNADHIFVASWGGGLLEFRGNELVNRYTNQNSPLETALPTQPNEPFVRIGGMAFDSGGNLWITNSEVAKNLVKLTPTGTWETFALPEVANSRNIGQIINTRNDDKWIVVPRGHDVYVVDKTGIKTKHLPVTAYFNNGTYEEFNRMNDVYSIAEDERGDIWLGTSKGWPFLATLRGFGTLKNIMPHNPVSI
jgi:ligand-binding sensor domain-containing protein